MTTARDAPKWFRNWWHMDAALGRTASESYASMISCLLAAPEHARLELAALLNPWRPTLERIKNRVDYRLNDCLCEMKPDYDDSITGFNEAWDIVRNILKEELAKLPAPPSEDK